MIAKRKRSSNYRDVVRALLLKIYYFSVLLTSKPTPDEKENHKINTNMLSLVGARNINT